MNIGLSEEETISDIYEINFIGQERKIFGVSLRKNGKRELVIANNDYNFEAHFYKMVQNGGVSKTKGKVFNMGEIIFLCQGD